MKWSEYYFLPFSDDKTVFVCRVRAVMMNYPGIQPQERWAHPVKKGKGKRKSSSTPELI